MRNSRLKAYAYALLNQVILVTLQLLLQPVGLRLNLPGHPIDPKGI